MIDFKLKLVLTVLSSVLFSLIFILLALVLPTTNRHQMSDDKDQPQTKFQKMSKGMREGFKK
ncbi:MAG TPA: hypothetical protein EYO73_11880 [Sulfurimonas sp.]|nr:hypothetical protein [Sulfurimonas sp.]